MNVINYTTLRFRPYRDREEFVNVGVVVYNQTTNEFDYKLIEDDSRIQSFFKDVDIRYYRIITEGHLREMTRLKNCKYIPWPTMMMVKEGVLYYGHDSVGITTDTINEYLQTLFKRYCL